VRTNLILLGAVAILALAGCALPGDDNANGGLANTAWTVISIGGAQTIKGSEPTMAFAPEGTVSGSGGCNQYSGSFRTDGDRITVGQLGSTLMLCEGEVGAQEQAFTTGLSAATSWRLAESGNLELAGMTEIVAEPAGPDGPPETIQPSGLPSTSWILTELNGSGEFGKLVPTLAFGEDGTVSGFGGCNTFSGTFTTEGPELAIGALTTTDMACEAPAGPVEAAYLGGLAGVQEWTLVGGILQLGGAAAMTFGPG
jgi:heat shock protein HslJ